MVLHEGNTIKANSINTRSIALSFASWRVVHDQVYKQPSRSFQKRALDD